MQKKNWYNLVMMVLIGICFSVNGQDKSLTVNGVVTDSLGTAIPGALIILTSDLSVLAGNLDSTIFTKVDTALTNSNGVFSKTISVPASTFLIAYAITKQGYQIELKTSGTLTATIDLGTIVLHEEVLQKITVSGVVVDSITKQGLGDALVIVTDPSMLLKSEYDSVQTTADGKFSIEVFIGASAIGTIPPMVIYSVIKAGYIAKTGTATPDQENAALDTLLLQQINSPIVYTPHAIQPEQKPDGIVIYSLDGQLLYKGTVQTMDVLRQQGLLRSQPYIIHYFRGKNSVGSVKYIPAR